MLPLQELGTVRLPQHEHACMPMLEGAAWRGVAWCGVVWWDILLHLLVNFWHMHLHACAPRSTAEEDDEDAVRLLAWLCTL